MSKDKDLVAEFSNAERNSLVRLVIKKNLADEHLKEFVGFLAEQHEVDGDKQLSANLTGFIDPPERKVVDEQDKI